MTNREDREREEIKRERERDREEAKNELKKSRIEERCAFAKNYHCALC